MQVFIFVFIFVMQKLNDFFFYICDAGFYMIFSFIFVMQVPASRARFWIVGSCVPSNSGWCEIVLKKRRRTKLDKFKISSGDKFRRHSIEGKSI